MRNQQNNGLIFRSADIEIIMKKRSRSEELKSPFFSDQSGFTLFFVLNSDISIRLHHLSAPFLLKKNQYILHYSPEESSADLWAESSETLEYLHIKISYNHILNLIHPEHSREGTQIVENMIQNNFIFLHEESPAPMTVEMHMIIKEIADYPREGVMQKLFIEAKIIKLLILIFEQFDKKDDVESKSKTSEIVKKFIDENYDRNIKAEEIGKRIGMNQNSIRKEFKAQYDMTITQYISELRMLKARKLITDKEIMIKEIAIECGYEYLQNFTRAFKKKFGISPEHLRNNT